MTSWLHSISAWFALSRASRGLILERNGGLGDLLCLLPSLYVLKQQNPRRKLLLITSRTFVPLMELAGILDAVISADTRGLRWWRWLLGVQAVWLPDELFPPQSRSAIHLIEEFARSLGIKDVRAQHWQLTPSAFLLEKTRACLDSRPLVLIHPGPTWTVKQWPPESWAKLIHALQQQLGVRVIQVGADSYDSRPDVSAFRIHGAEDWVGKLDLLEISAFMKQASLFIGVDSGLLHLAASVGTASVGLFGPTLAHCILPQYTHFRGVSAAVACLGCHYHQPQPLHWRSGCPHDVECMKTLSVDAVLNQCRALLSRQSECH